MDALSAADESGARPGRGSAPDSPGQPRHANQQPLSASVTRCVRAARRGQHHRDAGPDRQGQPGGPGPPGPRGLEEARRRQLHRGPGRCQPPGWLQRLGDKGLSDHRAGSQHVIGNSRRRSAARRQASQRPLACPALSWPRAAGKHCLCSRDRRAPAGPSATSSTVHADIAHDIFPQTAPAYPAISSAWTSAAFASARRSPGSVASMSSRRWPGTRQRCRFGPGRRPRVPAHAGSGAAGQGCCPDAGAVSRQAVPGWLALRVGAAGRPGHVITGSGRVREYRGR
jgi:hypothetical protein